MSVTRERGGIGVLNGTDGVDEARNGFLGIAEREAEEIVGGMRLDKFAGLGLTFDDVLLIPAHSEVLPNQVSTRARIAADIELHVPVLSAAMDTVTEARMAIGL